MNIAIRPENINIGKRLKARCRWSPGRPAASGSALPARWRQRARRSCSTASASRKISPRRAGQDRLRVQGVGCRYSPADMSKPAPIAEMIARTLAIVRPARRAGEQCRHPACRALAGIPGRKVGRDPRHQSVVGVPYHAAGAAFDAQEQVGPHHQHRFGARAGGIAVQVGLCRGQARHRRPDQGDRAGDRRSKASPATRSAPATSTRRWSRRRSMARPRRTAFRASRSSATCCSRSSRTSASPRSKSSARLPCFSQAMRRPRSPAWRCRWMAAGPRIKRIRRSLETFAPRMNTDIALKLRQAQLGRKRWTRCWIVIDARLTRSQNASRARRSQRIRTPDRPRPARRRRARRLSGGRLSGAARGRHRAGLDHRHLDRRHQCKPDRRQSSPKIGWKAEGILEPDGRKAAVGRSRPGPDCPTRCPTGRPCFGGIPGFFEPNPLAFLGTQFPLGHDTAGYYSTAPLEKTLAELVDFSLVNRCNPRLTVGAAHVRTSRDALFRQPRDGDDRLSTSWRRARCRRLFRPSASTASSIGTAASFPTRQPRRSSTTIRAATH